MSNEKVLSLLGQLMEAFGGSKPTTKYYNNDGTPANDITPSRENLIHVDEIKDGVKALIEANGTDTKESLEKIADPKQSTKPTKDKYQLTDTQRRWLLEYIFAVEGGYFNHPNDPGGETMYGIIKTEARAHGYNGPMKELPKEFATEIYLRKYWAANRLHEIKDFRVALCIFDFIVNSGNRGVKVAQMVINKVIEVRGRLKTTKEGYADLKRLEVDGKIGPATIASINAIDPRTFLYIYFFKQEDIYEDLMRANTKLRSFDEGWETRLATKALYLSEMERLNLID